MLKKIERLGGEVAAAGWTRDGVRRLIALVEEDGKATPAERASLAGLLARDRWVAERSGGPGGQKNTARAAAATFGASGAARPLPPARRRELGAYLDFVARTELGGPRRTLLGAGAPDVDAARYRRNVEILAGERATRHPETGAPLVFRDRFVPSPTHQLDEVAAWLEAYYRGLGFEAERQAVPYRGRTYYNVVVTIPGASPERVLLCDHYDVADKEPIHPRSHAQLERDHHLPPEEIARREGTIPVGAAVPGADDNASASAALMEMAALLRGALDRGVELERTIGLVHLVGEELPANCLGARAFVARAKAEQLPIAGVIVLDMIGVDRNGKKKVQISAGRHPASLAIAAEVKRSIRDLALDLVPVLRPYGARKSFLHQTDGIHFSKAGVPVVLLNEHVNDDRDLHRAGYHDEFDITALMSFDFATDVTRAALETAFRLANPGLVG